MGNLCWVPWPVQTSTMYVCFLFGKPKRKHKKRLILVDPLDLCRFRSLDGFRTFFAFFPTMALWQTHMTTELPYLHATRISASCLGQPSPSLETTRGHNSDLKTRQN